MIGSAAGRVGSRATLVASTKVEVLRSLLPNSPPISQDKLDFLHLPILDGNVTSDAAMSRLADDCCARILRGERMYVHW